MLSDNDINNLIQPILERQEQMSNFVIQKIAERVKEIGKMKTSDVYKLERLFKTGEDVREINKELARLTGLTEKEIKGLIKDIARESYLDTKPFYDYRNKPFIPFEENVELQRVVSSIAKQTADTYINLSNSRAFMIRDLKNPKKLIPTSISKTYQTVLDEAIQASQGGVIDYNTAMRRTMKQLSDSGIQTVSYESESGKVTHQQLDSAVKRNLLDGIRQINQGVQDEVGKQFGADGKEITVHEHSAPDHEPIQGHQFTNEEFENLQSEKPFTDVKGHRFEAIKRAIGEYNCRHFTYSIIIGINEPNFSDEELAENIKRNHEGYTDKNGKHHTLYECTQEQRRMERKIRQSKRDIMTGKACGDSSLVSKGKASLSKWQNNYSEFSKACGLSQKKSNLRVQGYRN